jgi:superfamily II DNA or RNA helicase
VKGVPYIVNESHILSLKMTGGSDIPGMYKGKVVNISVSDYLKSTKTFKHCAKGWRTGISSFINETDRLPIDPYFIGLWLGDGTTLSPTITTADAELADYIREFAWNEGCKVRTEVLNNGSGGPDYWTLHLSSGNLRTKMRNLRLIGNKHIPDIYKFATRENRLRLLAGILDSDGYLAPDKGCFDIVLKVERLFDDLLFLARSLGFAAYKAPCKKTCTNNGVIGDYFRCVVSGPIEDIPFRRKRHVGVRRAQKKDVLVTGIRVEPVGEGDYYGFELFGPDRLFLLGDFTVTHNTVLLSDIVHDHQGLSCVIAHRQELVSQLSMSLCRFEVPHRIQAPKGVSASIVKEQQIEFGRTFYNPQARACVAGVDTLVARRDALERWAKQVTLWVTDECFVAGTMISTPDGEKPIETVCVGDEVLAFNETSGEIEPRKVVRLFKNPAPPVLHRIIVGMCRSIECTANHPFWTRRGWINAADLVKGDDVYRLVYGWGKVFDNVTFDTHVEHVYNIEVDDLHTYVAGGVVVHNCHHLLRENKWGTASNMFPHAIGLGVTATPQRADGKGLGVHADGVFHHMALGPTMYDLIEMGNRARYKIVAPPSDFDVDSLHVTATGDFSGKEMREAARKSHIVGDVVQHYLRFAEGMQGITFATDVETANDIAAQFNAAGIPAQSVSAKTPDHIRSEFIRRFKRGALNQLVNVDLFGEGFDLPGLEVVSLARPTMSLAVFLQQVGRALRPSPETGKTHGLIIDHVGNVKRHGLPDKPRFWTLDAREKRSSKASDPEVIPLTTCLECYQIYERTNASCPYCGHRPEPTARRRPEQVDGDLTLLDQDVLETMRAAAMKALESPDDVGARAAHVAGIAAGRGAAARQREKIDAQLALREAIAMWAGVQRAKGRDDQDSYRRFYLTYGIDVLSSMSLGRSDAEKLTVDILTNIGQSSVIK